MSRLSFGYAEVQAVMVTMVSVSLNQESSLYRVKERPKCNDSLSFSFECVLVKTAPVSDTAEEESRRSSLDSLVSVRFASECIE